MALLHLHLFPSSTCNSHRHTITEDVLGHADSPACQELMMKYLYMGTQVDSHGMPGNVGYYVGTTMVRDLMAEGIDLHELTAMPGREVIRLWKGNTGSGA